MNQVQTMFKKQLNIMTSNITSITESDNIIDVLKSVTKNDKLYNYKLESGTHVKIDKTIATDILSTYKLLNTKNKELMLKNISANVESFMKVLDYVMSQKGKK